MKALTLAVLVLLGGGAKPANPPEKELTLEEIRALEMMEMLEALDLLMDENFVSATLKEGTGEKAKKKEESHEGKK